MAAPVAGPTLIPTENNDVINPGICRNATIFYVIKTYLPTSIVYRMTPSDHISAAFPEYL